MAKASRVDDEIRYRSFVLILSRNNGTEPNTRKGQHAEAAETRGHSRPKGRARGDTAHSRVTQQQEGATTMKYVGPPLQGVGGDDV
jgi:hypothetical protein